MPEFQMAGAWVETPCLFRLPDDAAAAAACNHCKEPFTFFNRQRYCDFCGYTFHRAKGCIRKFRIEGEFLRRRICPQCDFYRSVAGRKLCEGENFTCYRKGRPTEVTISLSEETGEVLFNWTSKGVTETLDLQSLQVQKGFSHAGHISTADYDPLKSLSLLAKKEDIVKAVDLKAPSAWMCQLWVKGLTAAKYVHQRMLEQQQALEWCNAKGEKVYYDCWFRANYLPTDKKGSLSTPPLQRYNHKEMSAPPCTSATSSIESAIPGLDPDEEFEELDISESDSSRPSSCEVMPSSLPAPESSLPSRVAQTQPIPTTNSHTSSPSRSHSRRSPDLNASTPQLSSTPHLPYRQSPLSSICGCHAYEITPSKCVSISTTERRRASKSTSPVKSPSPKHSKCCLKCELACQIALDLVNL